MPTRKYHLEFDEILRENGFICENTDGNTVHDRLDRHSKKYGRDHREMDEWHSPEGIRDFIDNLINSLNNIYQETATDYVRIAYGHIVLDEVASKAKRDENKDYNKLDWNKIYSKALSKFMREGFHRKRYRGRN